VVVVVVVVVAAAAVLALVASRETMQITRVPMCGRTLFS